MTSEKQTEPPDSSLVSVLESYTTKEMKNSPRERELERKRARGEISCAECRRLKLRCNKKVPCASCTRRGCQSICPNGQLTTGQGSRFVLANTHKLHGKLHEMSKRIRQLEDSLQIAQASISPYPHPLLSEDLLSIKSGVDAVTNEAKQDTNEEYDDPALVEAFETLSVSTRGEGRSIGRLATEVLLMTEVVDETSKFPASLGYEVITPPANLPEEIIHAAQKSPFIPRNKKVNAEHTLRLLEARFPSYERATALTEAYLQNVSWIARPIERDQIIDEILPYVKQRRLRAMGEQYADTSTKLYEDDITRRIYVTSLAFAIFACGASADLTQKPNNEEGLAFNFFARTALGMHSVFGHGECLESVQALMLIASYDFFSCTTASLDFQWKVMSYAIVLALRLGLHRDPAKWNLEPKVVQRRRMTFWNICAFDRWKALGTGRPPLFRMQDADVEFPEEVELVVTDDGSTTTGFYTWRHQFIKDIIGPISEQLCVATSINYSRIMEFDGKIREFPSPPFNRDSEAIHVRGFMYSMYKEIALLFLHKNFFARAMLTSSGNPLRSPFAPSFLAAYAIAIKFLRQASKAFEKAPELILRQWPVFGHTLGAGVIVGSIAARGTFGPLVTAAFKELLLSISLLEKFSVHPVASRGLPALYRLRDRASLVLNKGSKACSIVDGSKRNTMHCNMHCSALMQNPSSDKNPILGEETNLNPQVSSIPTSPETSQSASRSSIDSPDMIQLSIPYTGRHTESSITGWSQDSLGNPITLPSTADASAFGINPIDFGAVQNSVSGRILSDSLQTLYACGPGQIEEPKKFGYQDPSEIYSSLFPEISTVIGSIYPSIPPGVTNLSAQPITFEEMIRDASLYNLYSTDTSTSMDLGVTSYQWPHLEGDKLAASEMGLEKMDDASFVEDWSFQAALDDVPLVTSASMNIDFF